MEWKVLPNYCKNTFDILYCLFWETVCTWSVSFERLFLPSLQLSLHTRGLNLWKMIQRSLSERQCQVVSTDINSGQRSSILTLDPNKSFKQIHIMGHFLGLTSCQWQHSFLQRVLIFLQFEIALQWLPVKRFLERLAKTNRVFWRRHHSSTLHWESCEIKWF